MHIWLRYGVLMPTAEIVQSVTSCAVHDQGVIYTSGFFAKEEIDERMLAYLNAHLHTRLTQNLNMNTCSWEVSLHR